MSKEKDWAKSRTEKYFKVPKGEIVDANTLTMKLYEINTSDLA